jgi:hypothetical protein
MHTSSETSGSAKSPRQVDWLYLPLHVIALVAVSLLVFSRNSNDVFWGGEGLSVRLLLSQQHTWVGTSIYLGLQPIMGPGSFFYPINETVIPGYALQLLLHGKDDPVTSFTIFSVELLVGIYALGRALGFDRLSSAAAGWVIAFITMPYSRANSLGYPVGHLVPNIPEMMGIVALVLALFHYIGKVKVGTSIVLSMTCVIIVAWLIVAMPAVVTMGVPALVAYGLGLLVFVKSRREFIWKLGTAVGGLAILVAFGFVEYLWSLYAYTAASVFSSELTNYQRDLMYGSVLFSARSYSFVGPALYILGILGALLATIVDRSPRRRFAIVQLIIAALFLIAAVVFHQITPNYGGIKIIYFEFAVWPVYALYAVDALRRFVQFLSSIDQEGLIALRSWSLPVGSAVSSRVRAPILFGIVATIIAFVMSPGVDPGFSHPRVTPIVAAMQPTVTAVPGARFGGRVATFSGVRGRDSVAWSDLDLIDQDVALSNDHRLIGFWLYNIPTLQQNSQFITPAEYLLSSRLLARPADRQGRNDITLTKPDIGLLRLWGVRFLVVDSPPPGTTVVTSMRWDGGKRSVDLVELPNPNLGNYSPTETVVVGNTTDALIRMRQEPDYTRQVLLSSPLEKPLVRATDIAMIYEKGGYHIHARADGSALVLVPMEYSHCAVVTNYGGSPPRVIRGDLNFLGLLFEDRLDAKIGLAAGPFGHADCRAADLRDARQLDFAGAAKAFPLRQ